MTVRDPAQRAQGLTLIELLVALTVSALIAVLLLGGVRTTTSSWHRGLAALEQANDTTLVRDWLRQRLQQAQPLVLHGAGPEPRVAFAGEPGQLRFLAPIAAGRPGELRQIGLAVVPEPGGNVRVALTHRAFQRGAAFDAGADVNGQPRTLVTGLSAASFDYFGDRSGTGNRWHDAWTPEDGRLPRLVRIRFVAAQGQPDWPALIVAPRLEGAP